jgi:hypothetical protein
MSVHIGFTSPATTQTLRYQNAHSSGLALEYIKYFSHIGRGSITKYTLSVPAAGNSPPPYSIELSFSLLLYVLLCSAEYRNAEILVYKKHWKKFSMPVLFSFRNHYLFKRSATRNVHITSNLVTSYYLVREIHEKICYGLFYGSVNIETP